MFNLEVQCTIEEQTICSRWGSGDWYVANMYVPYKAYGIRHSMEYAICDIVYILVSDYNLKAMSHHLGVPTIL